MTIYDKPTLPVMEPLPQPTQAVLDEDRAWARAHIARRRKLRADVVAYVAINAFLVVVWALTGAEYFWPAWVLAGWGVALLLDVWNFNQHRMITDDEIDTELGARR
jgi:hypothetical protein